MTTISGKTEFDVFKNYYTAEKRESCRLKVNTSSLQSKDNVVSERLRQLAKTDFAARKYPDCLEKYTESLRHATCNGREYALALANRSATYFSMNNYKNCLIDISLCLEADYPINLKPKILIRKAKCFIKMGNYKKMIETIDDCCNQMQANSKLSKIDKDNYMKEMKSVMDIKQVDIRKLPWEDFVLAPEVIVDESHVNSNVSASIKLIHSKITGTDYVAARDIPRGEVLFVDTAYSVGFIMEYECDPTGIFICNYCLKEAKNCIPCKTCVNYSYCAEDCLNSAWTEYHQWECVMFRSELLKKMQCLPVRTLIKGAVNGAIFKIINNTKPWKFSEVINPYLQIYSLHLDLASFRSKSTAKFVEICERAATIVEFFKQTNFFTRLMSTPSCRKDFDTLVNFVGGLLIRHIIQVYQRGLTMNCESSIVSIIENQTDFELIFAARNLTFHAFCPTVSGVKYSCQSNTSMYFNGSTCIVKASQDIEAGNCIFRSGFNFTPGLLFDIRQPTLQKMDINCNCTACKNINDNIDILNTYLCIECGKFTVLQIMESPFMACNNCKQTTFAPAVNSMIGYEVVGTFLSEGVKITPILENVIIALNRCKKTLNPNHEYLYAGYRELLLLYSQRGRENLKEFKKALLDFNTCAKNRNGRFDTYRYMMDLTYIIQTCFTYLELNKSILRKQEIKDMLTYISDVVKEAKEIAEFTFPPFLPLYANLEFYIFEFRVAHVLVSLED